MLTKVRYGTLEYWMRMLVEQTRWMTERGYTRAGYQRFYAKFNRTPENIDAIYDADHAEFVRVRDRVRENRRPRWAL